MLRSIQSVAYSMQVQADRMNITANNIANINTRAFKKEVANVKSFDDVLASALQYNSGEKINTVGPISLGSSIDQKRVVYEQGYLEQTGFDTDFGIRGDGFFVIETPKGLEYTRAGNFTLDQNGYLVTQDGNYVLGEKGRMQFPDRKLKADMQGNIADVKINGDSFSIDKLKIVNFKDLNLLGRTTQGSYTNSDPNNIAASGKTDILQEFLESSNVNIVEETQNMMEEKRNFESCQQVIKMIDDTVGKASSDIGRV